MEENRIREHYVFFGRVRGMLDFDTAQNMLRMVSELPDGFEMTGMERLKWKRRER